MLRRWRSVRGWPRGGRSARGPLPGDGGRGLPRGEQIVVGLVLALHLDRYDRRSTRRVDEADSLLHGGRRTGCRDHVCSGRGEGEREQTSGVPAGAGEPKGLGRQVVDRRPRSAGPAPGSAAGAGGPLLGLRSAARSGGPLHDLRSAARPGVRCRGRAPGRDPQLGRGVDAERDLGVWRVGLVGGWLCGGTKVGGESVGWDELGWGFGA
jgi:hypothetical protein